jgi:hypothetical protein
MIYRINGFLKGGNRELIVKARGGSCHESCNSMIQLSGFVNSQKAVDKAGEITKTVKGVTSIKE